MRIATRMQMAGALVASAAMTVIAVASAGAQTSAGNGFLFGAPHATLALRMGYAGATAGSDIFSFVTNDLTLSRGGFGGFDIGGDVAVAVTPRLSVVFSIDNSSRSRQSEYRQWQDSSGNPIAQTTAFSRATYAVGMRYYLVPPGRSLGRLAWVPERFAPWVSASVGRTLYAFGQSGDFIDFNNGNAVFTDAFRSSKWTTTTTLAAGVDWSLTPRLALTTQARYLLGKADLQGDYSGFDPIDLSGVGINAGVLIRF